MASPQITVNEYSERSVVLRSEPNDFMRPYAEHLKQVGGKWNPNLRIPDGTGKLPGWIFSKRRESDVKSVVDKILNGEIPPADIPKRYASVPEGYQKITLVVLKPTKDQVLILNTEDQQTSMTVESVSVENNIVTKAAVCLPDGQVDTIELCQGRWVMSGLDQVHTIQA